MEKMTKCPFCKSTDIGVQLRADDAYVKDGPAVMSYSANCNNCQARGPAVPVFNYQKSKRPLNEEVELAISKDRQKATDEAAHLWNQASH